MLSFYLNGEQQQLTDFDTNLTLLRYLREICHLKGTKEGCASGDCGACTVLLGDLSQDNKWVYQSINACITLLFDCQDKHIVTIEGVNKADRLNSPQQAMLDCHGSQCGFCTPGVVMSLCHLSLRAKSVDSKGEGQQIQHALSGNLCRCTGYLPIIKAAKKMLKANQPIAIPKVHSKTRPVLTKLEYRGKKGYLPQTEEELLAILDKEPNANILAGGTDLNLEITQSLNDIDCLVSLNHIQSLKFISIQQNKISVGAAVSLAHLEPVFLKHFPEYGQMLHRFASKQIRHVATLAGNIANASPIGDNPPVMLALRASLELVSQDGMNTISIEDFFIHYKKTALSSKQIIRAIHIPLLKANEHLKVYKISKRFEDDISTVLMACKIDITDGQIKTCHIAFGGMAAIPKLALNTAQALTGKAFTKDTFIQAQLEIAKDFNPISDVRGSDDYRLQVAKNCVLKMWYELSTCSQRLEQYQEVI